MRVFEEEEGEEKETIPPVDEGKINPNDKGKVKKPISVWDQNRIPEEVKELIALDNAELGPKATSELHGVPLGTVKGIGSSEAGLNARALVTMEKHGIADLATAKLMQTLELLQPDWIGKETDKITVINGLSKVLSNLEDKNKDGKNGERVVHLHLYAPNQKKEDDYPVIEA